MGVMVSKNCPPPKFIGPTLNSKYNKKFWNLPSDEALNRAVHSHSPVWKMFLTEKKHLSIVVTAISPGCNSLGVK